MLRVWVCGINEKGIRDSPKVFVLSNWKHGIAKHERKEIMWTGVGGETEGQFQTSGV